MSVWKKRLPEIEIPMVVLEDMKVFNKTNSSGFSNDMEASDTGPNNLQMDKKGKTL